jgi:SWI/SNF-related matrix-associated actin-dependent regulator 1 of chromatin subfamily A
VTRKTPKPHQEEAIAFAIANNGKILNADCAGMGKSISAIGYLEHLNQWPVLIVAPSSVKGHWYNEIYDQTGIKSVIVEGETPYEGELTHKVAIINYNILEAQLPWLLEQQFSCIIFDECHNLANIETGWTKAAVKLAKRTPRVQGLSATPIANRPKDFYYILSMIRPDLFPSFKEFAWKYCAPRLDFGRWNYDGASNLDELHRILKGFMIRRNKSVLNLPPQTLRIEFVDMDNRESYDLLHREYVSSIRRKRFGSKNAGIDKLTLLQNLLMLVARCKSRHTVHWIKDYLDTHPKEKLIVFCTHSPMLDVIYRRAIGEGEAIRINGSVNSRRRTEYIERFQTDPSCRLAVCNIKSGSAGITLTAATKFVAVELPWNAKDADQLRGRNHRIGQKRETEGIFLLTRDTIEEKLCKVIQQKQEIHEAIIEGKKLNDLPIHKMLEMEMGK